jgi:2-polyprenyl-6-methoxyphenol hydroxylase-like FAD-dependent oxidoreductase
MNDTNDTVVIAGGGPTGLMLACELRLANVPVLILERRTHRAEVSQGMAIHGRTLEVLRWRGLADRIGAQDIFAWPRTPFALLWLDMATAREEDYTYAFPQWRLERLLAERAVELGADIRPGHEVTGVRQDDAGVDVIARDDEGEHRFRGRYLVGCDGVESRVRELAGIGFPAMSVGYAGLLGDMELTEDADRVFDAGVHPGGMFGAIPLAADIVRLMTIEFDVARPADDVPVTEDELAATIRTLTGQTPRLGKFRWLSRFGGPTSLADGYRAGRVFLAGDAAHSLFISGTQGINTGVQDAINLGWKLAADINGWAPPDLLDTYHAERRPVGERVGGHAVASMALLHPIERVSQLRDVVARLLEFEDVNRYLLEITATDRYPVEAQESAGTPTHPLAGGTLAGVPEAAADGVARALRAGRGVLLVPDTAPDDAAGWADRVDVVTAPPVPDAGAVTILVRPDGHVAHADVDGTDHAGLRAALSRWFGEPSATAGTREPEVHAATAG